MTESEAKVILESEYKFHGECSVFGEALTIAINALEKQIPKKPEPINYKKYMDSVKNANFLRGAYWCPGCKHVIRSGDYCEDCGQKLDWSDEDDD